MKRLLQNIAILALSVFSMFMFSYDAVYAYTAFYAGQVGTGATNGFVLETTGPNVPAQWVATSSLGIVGGNATPGGASSTVQFNSNGVFGGGTNITTDGTNLILLGALTYGGVTLSNAVTGTGNMVLSASPTFSGTVVTTTITNSAALRGGTAATANLTLDGCTSLVPTTGCNIFFQNSASTQATLTKEGQFGLGTTTPPWELDVATSSAGVLFNSGQLAITDTGAGTNLKHWLFSNETGNLYIGTTTDTYGTSSPSAISILNNGNVSFSSLVSGGTQCLQASAAGLISGTGTACGAGGGGVTSVTGTYPVISSGGATPAISLAFGTTTSNTWAGTQTFTNTVKVASLSGNVFGNNGILASAATSTETCSSPLSCTGFDVLQNGGAITLGTVGLANGGTATTTGGVTNGVEYYNGTNLTNGTSLTELNGNFGVGTTSPMSPLSVVGNENHWGNYYHFGSVTAAAPCNTTEGASTCLELVGSDNTVGGVGEYIDNINTGPSAYSGLTILNSLVGNATTNYSGVFLNGTNYNDNTFGTLNNVPNLLQLGNSMGPVSIQSFAPTAAASYISFFAGSTTPGTGPSASLEGMRLTGTGLGLGSTSPSAFLSIAPGTLTAASSTPLFSAWVAGSSTPAFYISSANKSGNVGIGTSTPSTALTVAANALGGILINTWTNITNALTIKNNAGTTVFNVDTTASKANILVGTSTQFDANTVASFSGGASATTTVNFGEIGGSGSKTCFNAENDAGAIVSFYFHGTTLVTSASRCN